MKSTGQNQLRKHTGRPGVTDDGTTSLPPLPVYSAQTIASVHTGIPITVFRAAKAAGCPAFVSNKVALRPFLQWSFAGGDEREVDHRKRKEKADADLAEIKVAEARGNLVGVASVEKWAEAVFTSLRQGILGSSLMDKEKDELINNCRRLVADNVGCSDTPSADDAFDAETDTTAEDDSSGMGEQIPLSPS